MTRARSADRRPSRPRLRNPRRVTAPASCGIALLAIAAACSSAPHAAPPTLYDRVGARLLAQPELAARLGKPAPEMQQVAWMVGTWDVTATVLATSSAPSASDHGTSVVRPVLDGTWLEIADRYPSGTQDLGFLTYDSAGARWVAVALDTNGNAVVTTAPPAAGALVFTGTVRIVGEPATLRQIIEPRGADAYTVRNEERLPDGTWRALDRYEYHRREP